MKTLFKLFAVSVLILFSTSHMWANQTIRGSVSCDGINIPDMASVRVNAFDSDGDIDELMGRTYLTNSKTFEIKYEKKKWDPFPMDYNNWWRPDIYLTVEIFEEGSWITVFQSEIYEDWKTNYDLELNIYVEFNEPLTKATQFSPSQHGWTFNTLFVEKQSDGKLDSRLSGALCFGALDKFYNYLSGQFYSAEAFEKYLAARQLDAEKSGKLAFQYQKWAALPDRCPWTKRGSIACETKKELDNIRKKIDDQTPAILVLISPSDNGLPTKYFHQVIAYQYEFDQTRNKTRLWLYDPEVTNKEEAILTIIHGTPAGSIQLKYNQKNPSTIRGFFMNTYDRTEQKKPTATIPGKRSDNKTG